MMRFPRLRFTVGRAMTLVAICALICWLVVVGLRVRADPETRMLYHAFELDDSQKDEATAAHHAHGGASIHRAPFWPRYWRRVLGQPWPGSYECPDDQAEKEPGYSTTFAGPVPAEVKIGQRDPTNDRIREGIERLKRQGVKPRPLPSN